MGYFLELTARDNPNFNGGRLTFGGLVFYFPTTSVHKTPIKSNFV